MGEGNALDRRSNRAARGAVPTGDCRILRRPTGSRRTVNRQAVLRLLGLLAIVGALAGYLLRTPHTPSGQPPLQTLKTENLSAFHGAFNDAAGKVRVILLLSPT